MCLQPLVALCSGRIRHATSSIDSGARRGAHTYQQVLPEPASHGFHKA